MTAHRSRKKPTRGEIEQENADLRDALNEIADILEDVGIIDGGDEEIFPDGDLGERDGAYDNPDFDDERRVKILNPEPAGIVDPKE